jgi:glyoxylate utilization-related uncharacterized protein
MARGNPHIRDIQHKGRKPVTDELFYFIINERWRVTKDTYNFVINERFTALSSGKTYELGKMFFSTLPALIKWGLKECDLKQELIDTFEKKIQGVTSLYEDGKLIVKVPPTIEYDKRDLPSEPSEPEEETHE